jgi:hypothetical protein
MPVEEKQVDVEGVVANGEWVFLAGERQVAAEFEEEVTQTGQHEVAKLLLGMFFCQTEEIEYVVVDEGEQVARLGIMRKALFRLLPDRNVSIEEHGIDLSAEFPHGPALASSHCHVEVAFGGAITRGDNRIVVRP